MDAKSQDGVAPTECPAKKQVYVECFNNWYSQRFLKGTADETDAQPCAQEWSKYQECLKVFLNGILNPLAVNVFLR